MYTKCHGGHYTNHFTIDGIFAAYNLVVALILYHPIHEFLDLLPRTIQPVFHAGFR